MKAIMISIKPKYVALTLNGDKTEEIRTTCPKQLRGDTPVKPEPIDVYIYCTKDSELDLVDYRGCDIYGDFRLLGHKGKLTTDDKQPRLNGKVVAKFTLNKVEKIVQGMTQGKTMWDWNEGLRTTTINQFELLKQSCLSKDELYDYLDYSTKKEFYGYAWHIDNLVIFDRPKELSEFYGLPKKLNTTYGSEMVSVNLTKAPQSWCYIEVIENE